MTRTATLGIAFLLGLSAVLSAKGATVRIVVTAGDLTTAIVVTDRATVRPFQVWAGEGVTVSGGAERDGFIVNWWHGAVAPPPATLPRYNVRFHVARGDEPAVLGYVVTYAYDPAADRGYVYLPGRGDPHAALNMRSIYRGGLEGHWLLSTGAWDDFIVPLVRP